MTRRITALVFCASLVLAACGSPDEQTAEETTTTTSSTEPAPTTTTTAVPETTVPPDTTTTTTSATTDDGAGSLLASLDATTEVHSARIEGSMEVTGLDPVAAGIDRVTLEFSASFNQAGDSSFAMDMSAMSDLATDEDDIFGDLMAAMLGDMEFRQVGDTAYVKFPFITMFLGADTEWVSMPAEEGEGFASEFQNVPSDPSELLSMFDDQGGATIEVVGRETVNGEQTTHYLVTLDTDAMDLSAAEKAELAESGIFAEGVIPMEIWISDAGYMVRMIMEIDGTGMVDLPPDERFELMTYRFDFFDINGNIVIEPPPASEVTSIDDLEDIFGFAP